MCLILAVLKLATNFTAWQGFWLCGICQWYIQTFKQCESHVFQYSFNLAEPVCDHLMICVHVTVPVLIMGLSMIM